MGKCNHHTDVQKKEITKLENYRPISLLSQLYKLFMKVITKRIDNKLDFYQPIEQAGFRSGFSTNDHLQVMRSLIEKCNEYKIEIALAFVDYEKAFDSVETWSILDSLDECRVDSRYTQHHVSNFMKIPPNSQLAEELDRVTRTHLNYSIQLWKVFSKN